MECFTIENLTFSYPNTEESALKNICLNIKKGEFVTVFGKSGCGKTTLLRLLKPTVSPYGEISGKILFENRDVNLLSGRESSEKIGFVMQSPDNQIVTDKVYHELAFGLESLGYSNSQIRTRVSEMASFFGIQTWFYKDNSQLSGGQKQILNLAGIMAMQPSVLILDEPTGQLDPIAASEFLNVVKRINTELGVTVILTEHRLEEAFLMSDRVIGINEGTVICDCTPKEAAVKLIGSPAFDLLPIPMRVFSVIDNKKECPVSVREARERISQMAGDIKNSIKENESEKEEKKPAVELKDVWFKYDKGLPDVVKGLSFSAYRGEMFCILGGNGTGKTTALSVISGILTPYRGQVLLYETDSEELDEKEKFNEFLGVLPQNPQTLFVKKTVKAELLEMVQTKKYSADEKETFVLKMAKLCSVDTLFERHPYDLSGGEQQRVALAKVLLTKPKILLLDEPTKGLDNYHKKELAQILINLKLGGVCIVMVSHDIEFCAKYADRCAMFFDGSVTSMSDTRKFFCGNSFYTTSSNRMARHVIRNAVLPEDIIYAFGYEQRDDNVKKLDVYDIDKGDITKGETKKEERSKTKKSGVVIALGIVLVIAFAVFFVLGFNAKDDMTYIYSVLNVLCAGGSLMCFFSGKDLSSDIKVRKKAGKLSKRTILSALFVLIAVPLTIFLGIYYLGDRKYYFISLLIIIEVIIPFITAFEGRKPQARELVIISVLCALGVAGRTAFAPLPQFKPVLALVIISGVCFGAETGFLVGAVTGFVSNMFLSQGPWTPWQMFAFGIVGFIAGILFSKGILKKSRLSLCVYGVISAFVIYGLIINPASVIMYQEKPTWAMIAAAYVSGMPFDAIHAASTAFFLWVISAPMIEKLERIKIKYGLIERN